jgi:hypothetical protein
MRGEKRDHDEVFTTAGPEVKRDLCGIIKTTENRMKNILLTLLLTVIVMVAGNSQSSPVYYSAGMEMPFSWANITDNGQDASSTMRFAPFFSFSSLTHKDFSPKAGIFGGFSVKNVGYIYEDYREPVNGFTQKKKFRTYNVGIPVGLKFGNLASTFIYGGYEIEYAITYKEKTFDGGDQTDKIFGWFSNRSEPFQHGFFAGIETAKGTNLKFRYYLSEFHNQDYTDSGGYKPYAGLESNIFFVSLGFQIYSNRDY